MTEQPTPQAGAPLSDDETRQWASFAHLGGILGFLPSLIIWLIYKDRSAFVAQEARTALNFQLTLLIGYIALSIIGFIIPGLGLLSGLLWIVGLVFSILGYQAVQRGTGYKYPFAIEIIK